MESEFEVCVIGAGLFGSACAKYVAESGSKTILVGPKEESREQTQVFGAWHDEGRITSPWLKTFAWRELTRQSIQNYRKIEEKSGISFYTEAGFLTVQSKSDSSPKDLENMENLAGFIQSEGFNHNRLTDGYVKENFPFLNLPSDMVGFHFDVAGYLSPRNLVRAQQILAERRGCRVVDGKVVNVTGNEKTGFKILVSRSDESEDVIISAKKLILAPGAYVNLNPWLKSLIPAELADKEPDLSLKTQTIAYLELEASEAARLKRMPSMVTHYQWGPLDGTYILPPILYPDGKYYLKLGHENKFERTITDGPSQAEEVRKWYNTVQGCSEAVEALSGFIMQSLIPDLKVVSVRGGCCVTAVTPGKIAPYIDTLADGITLVAGGNGYGAKCSDEIGRLGAKLSTANEWDSKIPRSECQIIWRNVSK